MNGRSSTLLILNLNTTIYILAVKQERKHAKWLHSMSKANGEDKTHSMPMYPDAFVWDGVELTAIALNASSSTWNKHLVIAKKQHNESSTHQ